MRIISGLYKGRKINGDKIDGTRPTMDRVKESLFAMIQEHINNSIVLDLFAGSGSLGLEALSNGAKFCYFNDLNKHCIKEITANINMFQIEAQCQILNLDYETALKYFVEKNIRFNIIFLDPPYKEKNINNMINYIMDYKLLCDDAIIVIEADSEYLASSNYKIYKKRDFGDKQIIILQK